MPDFGGQSQTSTALIHNVCIGSADTARHGQTLTDVGLAETEGFDPSIRFRAYDDLANRCLQPLGHVSANQKVTPYRGADNALQERKINRGFQPRRARPLPGLGL